MADVEEPADLLPGLPSCVVLRCILPRIPWHVRPLLKAACRAWSQALANPSLYSALTRRLSHSDWLLALHQSPHQESSSPQRCPPNLRALSVYDARELLWRRLPPIPALHGLCVPNDCGLACVAGKVLVIGGWDPRTGLVSADVYTLDLGGGLWAWRKGCRMNRARAFFHCRAVAQMVYVVGGSSAQQDGTEPPGSEVYDVARDEWAVLPNAVDVARYHHFNGVLAVHGMKLLAHGFHVSRGGELERFRRVWDPQLLTWSDWDDPAVEEGCGRDLGNGDYELQDGVLQMYQNTKRAWAPLKREPVMACHAASGDWSERRLLAVTECLEPRVYAIISCNTVDHPPTD